MWGLLLVIGMMLFKALSFHTYVVLTIWISSPFFAWWIGSDFVRPRVSLDVLQFLGRVLIGLAALSSLALLINDDKLTLDFGKRFIEGYKITTCVDEVYETRYRCADLSSVPWYGHLTLYAFDLCGVLLKLALPFAVWQIFSGGQERKRIEEESTKHTKDQFEN
jgi:hypothetical protein